MDSTALLSQVVSTSRTKPVISWPGGKSRLLKRLLPLPAHHCYVEAFAGGLALLLAKERSPIEVVNDMNGDLVSLYRCAQYHCEALITEIEWTLSSRANLVDFRAQPGLTELQRAARFLVRNKTSFGGHMTSYAVAKSGGGGVGSRQNVLEALRALNLRLDRASVEHLPYERVLKSYDGPETLFFLDPPYLDSDASAYAGWNQEQMTAFAEHVGALKGSWIVTVDDSPLNRELFKAWSIEAVQTRNGVLNQRTHGGQMFGELIIRKQPAEALQKPCKRRARRSKRR